MAAGCSGTMVRSLALALAGSEGEETELEFSYYSEIDNESCLISVQDCLSETSDSAIDILNPDEPDTESAESFHSPMHIYHGVSNTSTMTGAGPSACLTPVQLQLMQPPMHSTPISTPACRRLMLQESFEERSSESSMIFVQSPDISYCNFMHKNVVADSSLLQSCSTNLIDLPDSYVDCSSSLILIELNSVAHNDIAVETQKHSKENRETGNESKRKSLVTHEDCCNHHCLSHFTASEVTATSEYFKSKGVTDQNQFLLDSFKVMSNQESTNHVICGKPVCKKAYIKILEISEKRYKKIQIIFKMNPSVKI